MRVERMAVNRQQPYVINSNVVSSIHSFTFLGPRRRTCSKYDERGA